MTRQWIMNYIGCDEPSCPNAITHIVTYKDAKQSKVCETCVLTEDDNAHVQRVGKLGEKILVARWESRGGAHWVELVLTAFGFRLEGPTASVDLAAATVMDAEEAMPLAMQRVGDFQPDANTTPMGRVYWYGMPVPTRAPQIP